MQRVLLFLFDHLFRDYGQLFAIFLIGFIICRKSIEKISKNSLELIGFDFDHFILAHSILIAAQTFGANKQSTDCRLSALDLFFVREVMNVFVYL